MKRSTRYAARLLASILLGLNSGVSIRASDRIELAGDVVQYLLPATAAGLIESRWVDYLGRMFTFPRNGAPHGFCWKNLLFISEFISDAHGIECQVLREIGPRFQVIGHLA